jgi:integrase
VGLAAFRPLIFVPAKRVGQVGRKTEGKRKEETRDELMAIYKRGKIYWYKFNWNAEPIRESTKQGNPRVARQMEAAHKTSLAKGEVGIRDKKAVPTLSEFATRDFIPHVDSTFVGKEKTRAYYCGGVKALLASEGLSNKSLDSLTTEDVTKFASKRQKDGLQISSVNRELQVLRRMFHLAQEWGKVEKVLPKVRMLPGERHRDRVVTEEEETAYLQFAPPLLREVATILVETALRPEECFRIKWADIRDGAIAVQHGKTAAACRKIPINGRVGAIIDMRRSEANSDWLFPAKTKSGHIEPSSVKKQQISAFKESGVLPFELYCLRHTRLTRWAPYMDPWTLGYLAGHTDMSVTRRYVHPQQKTIQAALERASGHNSGHNGLIGAEGQAAVLPVVN